MLAILAGGAIGGLLTLSPLVLWAPSDPVVAPSATAEALRLEEQRAMARAAYLFGELAAARSGIRASSVRRENRLDGTVVTGGRIEVDPVEISPDGQQWIARQSPVYIDGVREDEPKQTVLAGEWFLAVDGPEDFPAGRRFATGFRMSLATDCLLTIPAGRTYGSRHRQR